MTTLTLKATRDKLAVLIIAILVGTGFIGWNFIAKPQLKKQAEVRSGQGDERMKKELVTKITGAEKRLVAFRGHFPEKGEISWLTEALNQLADAAGVSITSVTPMSRDTVQGYFRIPVRIEIECGYHQLGDFVSRVENNPSFIKINSMHIEGSTASKPSEARLRVTMTLSTFYPEPGPLS